MRPLIRPSAGWLLFHGAPAVRNRPPGLQGDPGFMHAVEQLRHPVPFAAMGQFLGDLALEQSVLLPLRGLWGLRCHL